MGGWKVVRGVSMCSMPCCNGYEERTLQLPLLRKPVICHKLTDEEIRQRQAALTTTPKPIPEDPEVLLLRQPHMPSAYRGMVEDQVTISVIKTIFIS